MQGIPQGGENCYGAVVGNNDHPYRAPTSPLQALRALSTTTTVEELERALPTVETALLSSELQADLASVDRVEIDQLISALERVASGTQKAVDTVGCLAMVVGASLLVGSCVGYFAGAYYVGAHYVERAFQAGLGFFVLWIISTLVGSKGRRAAARLVPVILLLERTYWEDVLGAESVKQLGIDWFGTRRLPMIRLGLASPNDLIDLSRDLHVDLGELRRRGIPANDRVFADALALASQRGDPSVIPIARSAPASRVRVMADSSLGIQTDEAQVPSPSAPGKQEKTP